jgi:hypothetical protein
MAYTYLIGWSDLDKWYYGVRYARDCHVSELWTTYFTSSSHVHKFMSEHGQPDVVLIRQTFTDPGLARRWESKVLRRIGAVHSSKWLNKTDNAAIDPVIAGSSWKSMSQDDRRERSRKAGIAANEKLTADQKRDRLEKSVIGTKLWWSTKSSEERRAHSRLGGIAAAAKMTPEQKEYRNRRTREIHNVEHKCPHCEKSGKGTAMKRWHFDNCKERELS